MVPPQWGEGNKIKQEAVIYTAAIPELISLGA